MSQHDEQAVLDFIMEFECPGSWDDAQVDRIVNRMAVDARYHVHAWEEPVVGQDALREEFRKQAPHFSDTRFEIVNVASIGHTVFVERVDVITVNAKRGGIHVVGVFDVDADGKIASYRDYCDSREYATLRTPSEAASP